MLDAIRGAIWVSVGAANIVRCSFLAAIVLVTVFGSLAGGVRVLPVAKAVASWQWYSYYCSQVAPGKQILRINLDETSVYLKIRGIANTHLLFDYVYGILAKSGVGDRAHNLAHMMASGLCDKADVNLDLGFGVDGGGIGA